MRKTILTVAMVSLTMGSTLLANEINEVKTELRTEVLKKAEINSFCKAVMQGDVVTVKKLIDLGEDVNQISLGMTPVMFAARYNKVEVLSLLIRHGANLEIKSEQGFTVKRYAELSNATEALEIIETALGS